MGGMTTTKYKNGHTCVRSTWRGKPCCSGSLGKYNALAKAVGMAIYLKLINGAWSTLSASGNTHAGGGAGDFEGDGYTAEQVYFIARCARDVGLIAYPRLWKGNWHVHVLDPDCQTLSAAAKAQIVLFNRGLNALVDNGPDPLDGYKKAELMARYNSRMTLTPIPTLPTAPAPVRKVNMEKPTGSFPWPNKGCYYGPSSRTNTRWYSGKVGSPIRSRTAIMWQIKRIQRMVGAYPDGLYGDKGKSKTAAAVAKWQKAHGLTADGIVGPGTWAVMVKYNR